MFVRTRKVSARWSRGLVVVGIAAAALAVPVAPAAAATTIGQNGNNFNCPGSGFSVVQEATAGPPGYAVPAGGGVITSWTVLGNTDTGTTVQMQVFRPAVGGSFTVTGETPVEALTPNAFNGFTSRLPVQAGDLPGLAIVDGSGGPCVFNTSNSGDVAGQFSTIPPVGSTATPSLNGPNDRVNVSANVEPDADGDGFGDETQDQCPTNPSTQGPCPTILLAAFGGIPLSSQTLTVSKGKVTVTLPCPANAQGNCIGTDTFLTAHKVVAPRITAAKKKKAKILTLGKARFSISPGTSGKVEIKLNKTALKLLARQHTLKATQTIVAHDARNVPKTTKGNLKLKAAKAKKKH